MNRWLASSILILVFSSHADADLRSFTETYEYSTVPEAKTVVELWHTQGRTTWDAGTPQSFEQIVELQHGITDKWDFAIYSVFAQVTGDAMTAEPFHFAELALETRYRLADRKDWPVDTELYLRSAKAFGTSAYTVQGRAIAARDFNAFIAAANAIAEVRFGNDVDTELVVGFAAGVAGELHPKLRIGAEMYGTYEASRFDLSVGPALGLSLSSKFWIAITAGFGLDDNADAFRARAIIGIEL
jgi:hypothetical protein